MITNRAELLRGLDLRTADVRVLQRIIQQGHALPFCEVHLDAGHAIFRCRPHRQPERRFTHARELSYKLEPNNISMGRCNLQGQSVFYGAAASDEIEEGRVIAWVETSSLFREQKEGHEVLSVSRWMLRKPMSLHMLVFSDIQAGNMRASADCHQRIGTLLNSLDVDVAAEISLLRSLLGDHFVHKVSRTADHEYKLTAALADLFLLRYPGFVFPSVQAEHKGFNVVLTPQAVDELLEFDSVMVMHTQRKGSDLSSRDIEFGVSDSKGNLTYKPT